MIYIIAVFLGLVACVLSFISEVTSGNITHLENGREPNAGAAIFPTFPMLPLLVVGIAWILQWAIPAYDIWILLGAFVLFAASWTVYFLKLKREFGVLSEQAGSAKSQE